MPALSPHSPADGLSALRFVQKMVANPLTTDFGRLVLKALCELHDSEQTKADIAMKAFEAAQQQRGTLNRWLHLASRPAPFEGISPGQMDSLAPVTVTCDLRETLINLRSTGLVTLTWRNLPDQVDMRSLRYRPTELGRQLLAASEQPVNLPALPIYFVQYGGLSY